MKLRAYTYFDIYISFLVIYVHHGEIIKDRPLQFIRAFKEHPESVGETYGEHLLAALGFSATMVRAALCCAVHAFLPFLFTKTASRTVEELRLRMSRSHLPTGSMQEPGRARHA